MSPETQSNPAVEELTEASAETPPKTSSTAPTHPVTIFRVEHPRKNIARGSTTRVSTEEANDFTSALFELMEDEMIGINTLELIYAIFCKYIALHLKNLGDLELNPAEQDEIFQQGVKKLFHELKKPQLGFDENLLPPSVGKHLTPLSANSESTLLGRRKVEYLTDNPGILTMVFEAAMADMDIQFVTAEISLKAGEALMH